MAEKFNSNGIRLCNQEGCEHPAMIWLVWTKPQVYCADHAQRVLAVAEVMGHLTPAATVRPIRPEEMVNTGTEEIESDGSDNPLPKLHYASGGPVEPGRLYIVGDASLDEMERRHYVRSRFVIMRNPKTDEHQQINAKAKDVLRALEAEGWVLVGSDLTDYNTSE